MQDNDKRGEKVIDRRSVLKTVGTTAVGGIALAGSGSAKPRSSPEKVSRIRETYSDERAARSAVARHADELLAGLAERGVVGETAGAAFFDGADDVTAEPVEIDGVTSGRLTVSREFADHTVDLVVFPERDRSFAYVHRNGETQKFSADSEDVAVDAACDCYYEYKCESLCPDGTAGYPHQRYSRECCSCDNGTACDDWSADSGVCCA